MAYTAAADAVGCPPAYNQLENSIDAICPRKHLVGRKAITDQLIRTSGGNVLRVPFSPRNFPQRAPQGKHEELPTAVPRSSVSLV